MKRVKMIVSMVALVVAVGSALAFTSPPPTEVWRKANTGGLCAATSCLLAAPISCADPGFMYFNNSACTGSTVSPKKN